MRKPLLDSVIEFYVTEDGVCFTYFEEAMQYTKVMGFEHPPKEEEIKVPTIHDFWWEPVVEKGSSVPSEVFHAAEKEREKVWFQWT